MENIELIENYLIEAGLSKSDVKSLAGIVDLVFLSELNDQEISETKKTIIFYTDYDEDKVKLYSSYKNYLLFIDMNRPGVTVKNYLKEIISQKLALDKSEAIFDFRMNIDTAMKNINQELARVKNIHQKIVPVFEKNLKNLKLSYKYQYGMSSGGEFYNYLVKEESLFILISSSKSYSISSLLINLLNEFQESLGKDELNSEFFSKTEDLIKKNTKIQDCSNLIQMFLVQINLNSLESLIITNDQFRLLVGDNQLESNDDKLMFLSNELKLNKRKLDRGEKLLIMSPGFDLSRDLYLDTLTKYNSESITTKEFLNEMFYQLRKSKNTEKLDDDAICSVIEVSKNAIVETV